MIKITEMPMKSEPSKSTTWLRKMWYHRLYTYNIYYTYKLSIVVDFD